MRIARAVLVLMPLVLKADLVTLPPLPAATYTVNAGVAVPPESTPIYLFDYTGAQPRAHLYNGSLTQYVIGRGTASGNIVGAADFERAYADISFTLNSPSEKDTAFFGVNVFSSTEYFVEVRPRSLLPTLIDFVPVNIKSAGSATCSGFEFNLNGFSDAGSYATVTIQGSERYSWTAGCGSTMPGQPGEFTGLATDLFGVRVKVPVRLEAVAGARALAAGSSQSALATATADPIFEIDPSFQYASYFELVYSDAGAASVPEPGSFPLACLVAVSFVARKVLQRSRH